jgi:hypothetical protein
MNDKRGRLSQPLGIIYHILAKRKPNHSLEIDNLKIYLCYPENEPQYIENYSHLWPFKPL